MHLLILLAQASGAALLILALFRVRTYFGLVPLYVTIGAFQYAQVVLANTVWFELLPGMSVSPGSVVLFPASLLAILLVYVQEDASEARKLCYGLMAANVTIAASSWSCAASLDLDGVHNVHGLPLAFFVQDARIMIVGTFALALDFVLLIALYEWFARRVKSVSLLLASTMACVLAFDSLVFGIGSFFDDPEFTNLLVAGIAGKVMASGFYAFTLATYLRFANGNPVDPSAAEAAGRALPDAFRFLTFRQKFHEVRELNAALQDSNEKLRQGLDRVRELSGMIRMCASCHSICDHVGDWHRLESFLSKRTGATFSHGICPTCLQKDYPGFAD